MSQQATAEDYQQQSVQALAEIQRQYLDNHTKLMKGELTPEEFSNEKDRLDAQLDATEHLCEKAAKLNLVTSRGAQLADEARRPALNRPNPVQAPTSEGVGTSVSEQALGVRFDTLEASVQEFRNAQTRSEQGEVPSFTLKDRALIERYLRPNRQGAPGYEIRKQLSSDDMDYLWRPRTETLMNAFVDRDGGWVTAEEMRTELIELRTKAIGISGMVNRIQTNAMSVSFPSANLVTNFKRRQRTGQSLITPERLLDVFGKKKFIPSGDDLILKVPKELVEDPFFALVPFLARQVDRIRRETDELLIIQGSGAGEALGFLTGLVNLYNDGATQLGIDGFPDDEGIPAITGSVINPELIQVFDTFLPTLNGRDDAVYTGPRTFERKVRFFRTQEGGVNTGEFMWKREIRAGEPNTLNGDPLLVSEFWPDNWDGGSVGDPLFHFGNLQDDYWWVTKVGLRLQVLNELYAETNEVGYKYDAAQDGSLVQADANIFFRHQ